MKIEQLQHVLEIQKYQSISKAARHLFVSQPSLSNSLSSFEEEIGVVVFERTHSGVAVTPEGEDVIALIEQAMHEINKILYYNCSTHDYSGEVRVLHTPAYGFMTYKLIRAMHNLYPNVHITLDERPVDKMIKAMQEGVAMIGVTTWGLFPEQNTDFFESLDLSYIKMNSRTLKAYVSANNPLASLDEISLEELKQQQFISYSSSFWKRLRQGWSTEQDAIILEDADDVKKGIYKGQSIALLPELFAIDDVYCEQGLIKLVSIEGDICMKGYDCILYPANKALSGLEKDVIKLIEGILKGEDLLCPA